MSLRKWCINQKIRSVGQFDTIHWFYVQTNFNPSQSTLQTLLSLLFLLLFLLLYYYYYYYYSYYYILLYVDPFPQLPNFSPSFVCGLPPSAFFSTAASRRSAAGEQLSLPVDLWIFFFLGGGWVVWDTDLCISLPKTNSSPPNKIGIPYLRKWIIF